MNNTKSCSCVKLQENVSDVCLENGLIVEVNNWYLLNEKYLFSYPMAIESKNR